MLPRCLSQCDGTRLGSEKKEREHREGEVRMMILIIIKTVVAVMIMMMKLFCVSANLTLHFDVVYVCRRCLTVCASFYTHIYTQEDLKLDCLF